MSYLGSPIIWKFVSGQGIRTKGVTGVKNLMTPVTRTHLMTGSPGPAGTRSVAGLSGLCWQPLLKLTVQTLAPETSFVHFHCWPTPSDFDTFSGHEVTQLTTSYFSPSCNFENELRSARSAYEYQVFRYRDENLRLRKVNLTWSRHVRHVLVLGS